MGWVKKKKKHKRGCGGGREKEVIKNNLIRDSSSAETNDFGLTKVY